MNETKSLLVVHIGSEEKGWIPTDRHATQIFEGIKKAVHEGKLLVTHPFVRFETIVFPANAEIVLALGNTTRDLKSAESTKNTKHDSLAKARAAKARKRAAAPKEA